MKEHLWKIVVTVLVLGLSISFLVTDELRLGLDLRGGSSFELQVQTEGMDAQERTDVVNRAVEIIRNRIDAQGLTEPEIYPIQGRGRIEIKVPGLSKEEKERFKDLIGQAAYLEFKLVHPENDRLVSEMGNPEFIAPPGYEQKTMVERDRTTGREVRRETLFVRRKASMTGENLEAAFVTYDNIGRPIVSLRFNTEGAKTFEEVTGAHVNERLAIVLDGMVRSAPSIRDRISGGSAQIDGGGVGFSLDEANELAIILQSGSLPTEVDIVQERSVEPTLGRASIQSGIFAGLLGMAVVIVFMWVYYRFAGLVATVALLFNIVILMGILVLLGATLTLPGIAGIILTIGMAVDANVLIFERIREELSEHKSLHAAIQAGYEKVFSTIFDANITTLLTAAILYWKSTGPVRGFAITLSVGILVSMFTALVVTRLIFDLMESAGKLKKMTMMSFFTNPGIKFLERRKIAYIATAVLIVASLVEVFVVEREGALGVDFTGGESIKIGYLETSSPAEHGRISEDDLSKLAGELGLQGVRFAYHGEPDAYLEIRAQQSGLEELKNLIVERYPDAGFDPNPIAVDSVGGLVGKELTMQAFKAFIWAMLGIVLYISIRFEFRFAVGAIVALIHDVTVTAGIFVLSGRQISLPVIAALLTIVGYSLNDTIVVFDRIRENLDSVLRKMKLIDLLNLSINQTLSRTILTSLTTLFVVLCLVLFGGGVINDFAFTLLVGIVVGTYSSIFVASPILLAMNPAARKESSNNK
jgi:SecD/SecF fusion protein